MFDRSRRLAFLTLVTVGVTACGGGGGGSPGTPVPTPTATGTTTGPVPQAVYTCSSSDTPSVALRGSSAGVRRHMARRPGLPSSAYTGLLAVTYSRSYARGSHELLASRERTSGASFLREFDHPYANLTTRIVAVPQARRASTEAMLRAQPGVTGVTMTGTRHYESSVNSGGYFTNDPYFNGFSTTLTVNNVTPPSTYRMGPYEESADVPGQWDMHAIGLEHAFAYATSNGSGIVNANALGSSAVKLAIIDSGQDTNNDDLGPKIAYQKCFITNPSSQQSTSAFTTDQDGHGTIVSGIAGAAFRNNTGFVGSGGAVSIYGYRVNPTPDDNCSDSVKALTDNQCGSDSRDIAAAIEDAIAQHVNVINLSLGAPPCGSNGQDPDATEGNAIADAIRANIVVVAAAGNGGTNNTSKGVASPACDPGVIAAGASALDDGQPNSTGHTGGTATNQIEYVAGYSDFGNPATSVHDTNAWGIVAPGGDAVNGQDQDEFHWIDNVWTTTPYMANANDNSFRGECDGDYPADPNVVVSNNCRTLINGTSMSSPIVAGAAALIIAAAPTYQSPSAMKRLLCQTADDIGDAHEGCGRLNVYRAMAKALNDPNPP